MTTKADLLNMIKGLTQAERARLEATANIPYFLSGSFNMQKEFINDTNRFKLLLGTRRSGKSFGAGLEMFKTAYDHPGCNILYLALTKSSAVGICWKDILHVIADKYRLDNITFRETDHSITFPNGSNIYIGGVDSNELERRKLFGRKYKLVIIDEAGAFTIDVTDLVYSTIKPTLIDEQGTLELMGMPGDIKAGLFFDLTGDQHPTAPGTFDVFHKEHAQVWKGYKWTGHENTSKTSDGKETMADRFDRDIATMRALNPQIDLLPSFKQHWLGEWATDETLQVYQFNPMVNTYDGTLPKIDPSQWHYILGADLGFKDPTAFVVLAWHPHTKTVYIPYCHQKSGMSYDEVEAKAKALDVIYHFDTFVIDGSDLQGVETMRRNQGVPWVSAQKQGKAAHIGLMNSAFLAGNIKCSPVTKELQDCYPNMIWTSDTKQTEHPSCHKHSHLPDAALYAWYYSWSFDSTQPKNPYEPPQLHPAAGDPMFQTALKNANRRAQEREEWL